MKYGALAILAVALAAPAAQGQGMWWVEGDRYCSDYGNNSRNSAMCGNPRRGEVEPRPTYRLQFNSPRIPFLQGDDATRTAPRDAVPAPTDRPARRQQR